MNAQLLDFFFPFSIMDFMGWLIFILCIRHIRLPSLFARVSECEVPWCCCF